LTTNGQVHSADSTGQAQTSNIEDPNPSIPGRKLKIAVLELKLFDISPG
jgi:hypothetical protein